MKRDNISLVSVFKNNAIAAIIITALFIALAITYLEYQEFQTNSRQLEAKHHSEIKDLLQSKVTSVTQLIERKRSQIESRLKQRIRLRTNQAHASATQIYNTYHNIWPEDKLKDNIKAALRSQRFFNGDGYYFAHSLDGTLQVHGLKPHIEGQNRLNFKDSKGHYIVQNLLKKIKKKSEGFHSYSYVSFSQPDLEREKVVFVKHFKPYNWSIGTGDYKENIENIIKQEILDYIEQANFGKNGYIFVVDYQGTVVMNTSQRHLIGKNIWNLEDPNGVKVIQEERKAVENPDGAFIYYTWNNPSTSKPSPKISFMKGIADWQWMIGAGLYLDDIQSDIDTLQTDLKNQIISKMTMLFLLTVISVFIVIIRTNYTAEKISREQVLLIDFFKNLSSSPEKIDLDNVQFTEFTSLAQSANIMLDRQENIENDKRNIEIQLRQSQKMEALGKIVGGIAHDFNNLLGIMMGYAELLKTNLSKDPANQSYACQIFDASMRGSKLTKKLLGISRSKEQFAEHIELNTLLNENRELLQKTITARVLLDYNLEEPLPLIYCDQSDLNDCLLNLCINAMHAMKDTEFPKLSFKTSHILIPTINAAKLGITAGQFVELAITDNGIGIDEQILEHVFEPFFTTKGDLGTGLGLSQVYAFMKRCNGAIEIDSLLEKGTRVALLFPAKEISREKNRQKFIESKSTEALNGNETVLIVDDEPSLTAMTATILENKGYKTLTCNSGKSALDILSSQKVDLLISDIIMPEMSGDELATIVKQQYPQLPIQLASGYSEQHNLNQLDPELHKNILIKPFDSTILLQRIRSLLNQ